MAPSPFRRRKAAKTVRNLAVAEAALQLAKSRAGRRSRRPTGKLLAIGGAVAAVGAAALFKRDKVAGLLPSRSGEPAPPAPAPVQPSSYDAPAPVADTATPIPAPEPRDEPAAVDEAAEAGETEVREQEEANPGESSGGGISGRPYSGLEAKDEPGESSSRS